jgi:hypothetical protein
MWVVGAAVLSISAIGFATASPAIAGQSPIGIKATWNYPANYRVEFQQIGANCVRNEVSPKGTVGELSKSSVLHLFDDHTGSFPTDACWRETQNVQYKVTFTSPTGASAWTNINVTSSGRGGIEGQYYRVDCYGDNATLGCAGDGARVTTQPGVRFGPAAPAGGYTFCSLENTTCNVPNQSAKTVAYGVAGHFLYWNMDGGETSIPCDNATWGDPQVQAVKACWVRYR